MANRTPLLFVPINKVDEEQRLVYGRATQEVPDSAREIMDYASSVPLFRAWSEGVMKRTSGKSKGNIRAMHSNIAAGKMNDMIFNDEEKAVDIVAYIADDNEWKKIQAGVYSGFSVGGAYKDRWPDSNNPNLMRYTAEPHEISLVDAPAVPSATFMMVKSDGTQVAVAFQGKVTEELGKDFILEEEVEESATAPLMPDIDAALVTSGNVSHDIQEVAGVLHPITEGDENGVEVARVMNSNDPANILNNELSKLRDRGLRVGISRREGEPNTPVQGMTADLAKYADPANYAYLCDNRWTVFKSAVDYNKGIGREKYALSEWMTLGRRIARMASDTFGKTVSFNPIGKNIGVNNMAQELNKVDVMGLLAQCKAALASAADQIGNDPKAAQDLLMGVLGQLDGALMTSPADTSTSTPTPPTGEQEGLTTTVLKADAKVSPLDTKTETETESEPDKKKKPDFATTATTTDTPTATDSEGTKKMQELEMMVKSLIAKLEEKPVQKSDNPVTIGDLAALIENNKTVEKDPAMQLLAKGDVVGAMKASNKSLPEIQQLASQAFIQSLVDDGVVSSRRFVLNGEFAE